MRQIDTYEFTGKIVSKFLELPQFLLPNYGPKGIIAITQPRRVAAVNLARRVAEETGTQLRNKVAPPQLPA